MNKQEIKQAITLLEDRADRLETIIDGDGQSLTAYWLDGGQRMFCSMDEVHDHVGTLERFRRDQGNETACNACGNLYDAGEPCCPVCDTKILVAEYPDDA